MRVHVCTCLCMSVHACACVCMSVHVCTCVYMCVHVCTCRHVYASSHVFYVNCAITCVCRRALVFVFVRVCVRVYVCVSHLIHPPLPHHRSHHQQERHARAFGPPPAFGSTTRGQGGTAGDVTGMSTRFVLDWIYLMRGIGFVSCIAVC